MSDNPLDNLPDFDRVMLRAVLVEQGEDPRPALVQANIIDPVELPVVLGEDPNLSGGILGDGITPNVVAVLETQHEEAVGEAPREVAGPDRFTSRMARSTRVVTSTLPAVFGNRPLAPVRQRPG